MASRADPGAELTAEDAKHAKAAKDFKKISWRTLRELGAMAVYPGGKQREDEPETRIRTRGKARTRHQPAPGQRGRRAGDLTNEEETARTRRTAKEPAIEISLRNLGEPLALLASRRQNTSKRTPAVRAHPDRAARPAINETVGESPNHQPNGPPTANGQQPTAKPAPIDWRGKQF